MGTTPKFAFRYPALADPPDVPTDMSELATDVEAALTNKTAGTEVTFGFVTANVDISATTEAAAQTVIAGTAAVYDGRPVVMEFQTAFVQIDTVGQFCFLTVFDGSTPVGRIATVLAQAAGGGNPVRAGWRAIPTAASHTYSIRAHTTGGTAHIYAGGGGSGAYLPASWRIYRTEVPS